MPAVETKAIALPDTKSVDTKALAAIEAAKGIMISNRPTYEHAGSFLVGLKAIEKEINDTFDPVIKSAYEAHKAAIAARDKHRSPIIEAEKIVKLKMGEFQKVEEKRLREEEERLREMARQEEEAERNRMADRLIEEGRPEEALALLGQQVETPPIIMPEMTAPKIKGVMTRTVWKFRIKDEKLIPRDYLVVDEVKIGKMIRATEGKIEIPGIEVYQEKEIAVGGRG